MCKQRARLDSTRLDSAPSRAFVRQAPWPPDDVRYARFCGSTWEDANENCATWCPEDGDEYACPYGELRVFLRRESYFVPRFFLASDLPRDLLTAGGGGRAICCRGGACCDLVAAWLPTWGGGAVICTLLFGRGS
jgi:hypothetical protein